MLPFARILAGPERDKLRHDFEARWGAWYGGYCDREPRKAQRHITLHVKWVDALPQGEETIRELLRRCSIERVFELWELSESREVDLSQAKLHYSSGGEGFWFDGAMEWMIYASHEASITFGGDGLVDLVSATVPDILRFDYRGWQAC